MERDDKDIRIFFQNVKGLTYSYTGEDYDYYMMSTQAIGADIIGMAETNTAWQHHHLRSLFNSRAIKHFGATKISYGYPDDQIDLVPERETFQSGGSVTMTTRHLVPMVHGDNITDPTGLGRWSGHTLRGTSNTFLSIITAYRVCTGSIGTSTIGSAFSREYEHLRRSQHLTAPRPRKIMITDLITVITNLQQLGNTILLMLDSNAQIQDDLDLQRLQAECDLHDLHQINPAPSTYIGSEARRIDHMFGCSQLVKGVTRSGSLSYLEGPQSDHRGLFVDLDPSNILGHSLTKQNIAPPVSRSLKSGNPALVEEYIKAMRKYYDNHNMVARIQKLYDTHKTLSRSHIKKMLERWDRDQGRAMAHAESIVTKPRKPYSWSPKLRDAGIVYRYWRLRHREEKYNEDYAATFDRIEQLVQQTNPMFVLPLRSLQLTKDQVTSNLNEAATHLRTCQKNSIELRFQSYADLLATYENDRNPDTKKKSERNACIVRKTIRSEQSRTMFQNIRSVVKPTETSSLNKLMLPRHKDTPATYPKDFQSFLQNTDPDDIIWDTVLDQATIESNLLRYNRNSFRAAAASPCGHGTIFRGLTFNSLSRESEELLSGTIPAHWYGQDHILREFLTSFAIPDNVKTNPAGISTDITEDHVRYGFKKWKETTSTSPSGRHLGHYKALIQDDTLLKCLTQFMHITVKSGLTLRRWCNAVNILIEKDPGQPKITRLRIIHLFEADFNLFLKMIWGSRLVKRAVKLKLLNDGQHGSIPQRKATDPIMLTQLTTDLCRILKHNLARFDNDASACYDRIIVALGMLAARRCGMPETAVQTHADCLRLMKYTVKTVHGVSENNYHGTTFEPLFGTGQGSGASPSVWLTLVVVLMNTLDRIIPERMHFNSPDSTMSHKRLIDAFVDDTSLGFTDPGLLTLETMIAKLNNIAQTWERLLFCSGGALNLSKCSWYTMYWDWKHGRPILRPIAPEDPHLSLDTQGNTNDPTPIKRMPLNKASRILGVYLAPDGNFTEQLRILKTKADGFAIRLRSPKLTPRDIKTFHQTMYAPAMRYVLPCLAIDEEEMASVQTQVITSMLQKLGYSSKLPTAIRYGPAELGGLELIDLRTELGISTIKYMRDSIYSNTEAGKLMVLNVKYSQIESGISEPLLEHPGILVPYLTPTWITSIRQYLFQHNLTVSLTDTIKIHIRGKFDKCIMNTAALSRYTTRQQSDINLVRIHLQIITLSDMSHEDGTTACIHHAQGARRPDQKIRTKTWPRQEPPTKQQVRLWKRYISSNFLRYLNKWKTPLGVMTQTALLSTPIIQHSTLQSHIASLPLWHRRLLFEYKQLSSDIDVWRAFRSRKRLTIASDGSLREDAGTFGWKLTTQNYTTLFHGYGPVDGPMEIGSSTRSELGGFTAPLLLVTVLARHWGLRHRCTFRWLADSKVAINRVTFVTRKDHSPTKQPDNSDYLSTIKDLFRELRRPLKTKWIKSHQDGKMSYDKLTPDAKLNVDVDDLATKCHNDKKARPRRATEHIPAAKMSISILNTRYYGNVDDHIRYHINGGYLRCYTQGRHSWSDKVWNMIDMEAFGRNFKVIPLKHQPAHAKFIHNQLPLGDRLYQRSAVKDDNLKKCPLCQTTDENIHHFIHCSKNINRSKSIHTMLQTVLKDEHPSKPALASCIEQYLTNPGQPITFNNDNFPITMEETLQQAIEEQTLIGWHQLLLGYTTKTWRLLASMDPINKAKPNPSVGRSKIHTVLKALTLMIREIWLGRNEILHSHQDEKEQKVYSMESAELRHYHSNPTLIPTSDQHYCRNITLNKLLQSRPSVRRRWLKRVKTARAAYLKDGRNQQMVTQYLVKIPATREVSPRRERRPLEQTIHTARTQTTQQRMTSFFPGRPPDKTSPPTKNPSPTPS
jgi:hypothetical protein